MKTESQTISHQPNLTNYLPFIFFYLHSYQEYDGIKVFYNIILGWMLDSEERLRVIQCKLTNNVNLLQKAIKYVFWEKSRSSFKHISIERWTSQKFKLIPGILCPSKALLRNFNKCPNKGIITIS